MKEITPQELKALIDEKKDFQLIDIRDKVEKNKLDMGGELIEMGRIPGNLDKINDDKQVILYCKSGVRSAKVVAFVEEKKGHKQIYSLKGGILAWKKEIKDD